VTLHSRRQIVKGSASSATTSAKLVSSTSSRADGQVSASIGVVELLERYVPPERQEAEITNLIVLAQELADTPEALVPAAALRTRDH
jgi:hypothetical protein